MSLKNKLLILLILLPTLASAVYAVVAINLFKSDKKAYVYESSASISKSLADQLNNEIQDNINYIRTIILGFDPVHHQFAPWVQQLFDTNKKLSQLSIVDTKTQKPLAILKKENLTISYDQLSFGKSSLNRFDDKHFLLTLSNPFLDKYQLILVALLKAEGTLEAFQSPSPSSNFLINKDGQKLAGSKADEYSIENWNLSESLNFSHANTIEMKTPDNRSVLVSNSPVSFGDLQVVSVVDSQTAFRAMTELTYQTLIFLFSMIMASILVSMVASKGLTSKLKQLLLATQEISKGNYQLSETLPDGKDEIGVLSGSFSNMAVEIDKLMKENIEKARMETELKTAQTVQRTLFPLTEATFSNIELSGFYEPATECGGDWWHYSETSEQILLWIGDATGHGAPAALITSAAKAVSTIVEYQKTSSPSEILSALNYAIHGAAKGEVCMTFFVACLDKKSQIITYSNASHEAPIVLPDKENLKRKDMKFLDENNGPRLGQSPDSKYKDSTYQLLPQEYIYFYTDGVTELFDPSETMYGERRLRKALFEGLKNHKNDQLIHFKKWLVDDLYNFRMNSPLEDDVTFFVVKNTQVCDNPSKEI